jgi:hypothetical protein
VFSRNKKPPVENDEQSSENHEEISDLKSLILLRYMSKNQFANPEKLVKEAIKVNAFTLCINVVSLIFCLMAIAEIWGKNSDVGLYVQRIDGVKIEVVNDARSKILLRKALQNGLTKEQIKELNLE